MENNQLSGRNIFNITDWDEFISLNGLLGQIQLASELETKINEFKYNFLKSKLYTFDQLLEKDDICWLCFNYIDPDITYTSTPVYNWLGKSVILGTPLHIDDNELGTLYSDYKKGCKDDWFSFSSWCRISYKKVLKSNENPKLLQLFLNQAYFRNSFSKNYLFYSKYGGLGNDLGNLDKKDLVWAMNSFYLIYQKDKTIIDRLKKCSHGYYIDFSKQERLIDILGGKEFLEKINKEFSTVINKLRSSYKNRLLLDKNIGLNNYLYAINKYNQPIPVQLIENIKGVDIYIEKNKLCFITSKPNYHNYTMNSCFRQYGDLYQNNYLLVFSTKNGELSEIYEKTYRNEPWTLTSKLF